MRGELNGHDHCLTGFTLPSERTNDFHTTRNFGDCSADDYGVRPTADQPVTIGIGPTPQLLQPSSPVSPTVNIAPTFGWPNGAVPTSAPETKVVAFASALDHPRWVCVCRPIDRAIATEPFLRPRAGRSYRWFQNRRLAYA